MTDQENVALLQKFLADNNLTLKVEHILKLEQAQPVAEAPATPPENVTEAVAENLVAPESVPETSPDASETPVDTQEATDITSN